MRGATIGLISFVWGIGLLQADTIKLICHTNFNGAPSGLMEIDMENRVVYRFEQRAKFAITGLTSEYITMVGTREVGGDVAVLDLGSGVLQSAEVGFVGSELKSYALAAQTCRPSILSK